jgi:hypothetical protein
MADARSNFAYSTVTTAPSPATSGTSLVVAGGTWPATPFNAVVHAAGATEAQIASGGEIIRVTNNASGTFTITRAAEGPNSARSIVVGDIIKAGVTKKTLDDILSGGPFSNITINTASSTFDKGFNITQAASGHDTDPAYSTDLNRILITSDDIDTNSEAVYGLFIKHNFGGSAATGQRLTLHSYLHQSATTSSSAVDASRYYLAMQGTVVTDTGDGGTNTTTGSKGGYMAQNLITASNGPNVFQVAGLEVDIINTSFASQQFLNGISVCSGIQTHGAVVDSAYDIHSLGTMVIDGVTYGPGDGFKTGFLFWAGGGIQPITTDGTLFGAYIQPGFGLTTISVAKGIDFANFTFSGNAVTTPNFQVAGGTVPGNVHVGAGSPTTDGRAVNVQLNDNTEFANVGIYDEAGVRAIGFGYIGSAFAAVPARQNHAEITTQGSRPIYVRPGDDDSHRFVFDIAGNFYLTGTIGDTSSRVTKGWYTDLEVTNAPTLSGVAIPSISSTNTLTNKRVTPRTGTAASSATPTINTDNVDFYSLTAQAANITSFTTNLSGTPTDGQKLWIAITGTASRTITWGTSFEASTVALPTTTSGTSRLDVGFVWNTATSKWRCVAVA